MIVSTSEHAVAGAVEVIEAVGALVRFPPPSVRDLTWSSWGLMWLLCNEARTTQERVAEQCGRVLDVLTQV